MSYKYDILDITDLQNTTINDSNHLIMCIHMNIKSSKKNNYFYLLDPKQHIYRINNSILIKYIVTKYPQLANGDNNLNNYIPLGDMVIKPNTQNIIVLLANKLFIPSTKTYERFNNSNLWSGVIRKGDRICRSLGLIMSKNQPTHTVPVFPNEYIIQTTKQHIDHNLVTTKEYGYFILNKHLLTNKLIQNTNIDTNNLLDDDMINHNLFDQKNTLPRNRKRLLLHEKKNPWFNDPVIIGNDLANEPQSHKITGINTITHSIQNIFETPTQSVQPIQADQINNLNNMFIIILVILLIILIICRIAK